MNPSNNVGAPGQILKAKAATKWYNKFTTMQSMQMKACNLPENWFKVLKKGAMGRHALNKPRTKRKSRNHFKGQREQDGAPQAVIDASYVRKNMHTPEYGTEPETEPS